MQGGEDGTHSDCDDEGGRHAEASEGSRPRSLSAGDVQRFGAAADRVQNIQRANDTRRGSGEASPRSPIGRGAASEPAEGAAGGIRPNFAAQLEGERARPLQALPEPSSSRQLRPEWVDGTGSEQRTEHVTGPPAPAHYHLSQAYSLLPATQHSP